jgi:predicted nucleotidyltransferase
MVAQQRLPTEPVSSGGVMMSAKIPGIVEEVRASLVGLYGERLVALVLYGSQARGDAAPGSDIDLMVVLASPVDSGEEVARTSSLIAEISLANDVVISCVFVDSRRYRTEQSPLLIIVRREGIAV